MRTKEYDLLIKAGRLFCSASGLDGPGAVGIRDGRIVAAGPEVIGTAEKTLNYSDDLLLPGLVDLHAHPAHGGSKYGIDPDVHMLTRGVTTVLSQGDAGVLNWPAYKEHTIAASQTRVLLAINLAASGESGANGCFADLSDVDVEACVRTIEENGDGIWGIAINTSLPCCGDNDPDEILARGLEAAQRTAKPLLFGSRRNDDRPLAGQLKKLRHGDVFTYCFNGDDQGLVHQGRVRDEVWKARERGVLFDIGHGMASFDFAVAEAAINQGFFPDTISTDQYRRHVDSQPPHDLPRTMSKLIAAGMPEAEALKRVSARPAEVLGLGEEVGRLTPGACADLALLHWNAEAMALRDSAGVERPGGCWEPLLTVRAGRII